MPCRSSLWGATFVFACVAGCGERSSLLEDDAFDQPIASATVTVADSGGSSSPGTGDATLPIVDAPPPIDAAGSSSDATVADAPDDVTIDAPLDVGSDTSVDAGTDAMSDAAIDADDGGCPSGGAFKILALDTRGALDQIALDADYVYFHDQTGVYRVSKNGGPTTQVATTKSIAWPDYTAFAVGDTNVIWWQLNSDQTSSTLYTAPKSGGTQATLATVPGYSYSGFLTPSGSVDVLGASSDLLAIDADGGVTTVTSALPYESEGIAYDDDGQLFVANLGGIYRFDGTSMIQVAATPGLYVGNLTVDDENVYVSGEQYLVPDLVLEAVIGYAPKTGGSFAATFERTGTYTWMATDAYYVYMTDRWSASVLKMQKDGVYQQTLVQTGGNEVLDVVVDDNCVYFTGDSKDGAGVFTASKGGPF